MTRTLITFLMLFCISTISAQIHEVGVSFGGANYVGDVGSTQYIAPKELGYGIVYRWNRSPRHSFRFSYTQLKIAADDAKSDMGSRKERGYAFKNNLKEISLGMEFNFFEFDLHEPGFAATPYLYSGLAGFQYDEFHFKKGKLYEDGTNKSLAIPIVAGFKARLGQRLIISAEVGARYTFTDNLDGSAASDTEFEPYNFGKKNNKDWYFYSGLTLTYTFGKNPCYCTP